MYIVSGRVKSFFAEALRHWRWYDGVNLRKFDFRVLLGRVLSGQPCQCSPRICDIWICIIQSCTRAVDAFECVAIETEACRCKSIDPTETKRWRSPWWKIAFVVFVPSSCALTNFCLLNQYFSSSNFSTYQRSIWFSARIALVHWQRKLDGWSCVTTT